MIVVSNILKSGRTANAASYGGDFHFNGNAGDVIEVGFRVSALSGAPTAASFAAKWQFAPKTLAGLDEDSVSSLTARKWFDVVKTDPVWTSYFVDETGKEVADWPAVIADQTSVLTGAGVIVFRKIRLPAGFLVRTPLILSFTGGTSPAWTHTQTQAQYSRLA